MNIKSYLGKSVLACVNIRGKGTEILRGRLLPLTPESKDYFVFRYQGRPYTIHVCQLMISTRNSKVSWSDCNWAPAHLTRLYAQDCLYQLTKDYLSKIKIKGYYKESAQ